MSKCEHRKAMDELENSIQHKAYQLELYEKGLKDGIQYPINDDGLKDSIMDSRLAQTQHLVMLTIEKNKELEKERDELKTKALHIGQKLNLVLGLNEEEIEFMKECGGKFEEPSNIYE